MHRRICTGISPRITLGLLVFLALIPFYAAGSSSLSETSQEGLAIAYLAVYVAEEYAPKGNVHCGSYECHLFEEKFDISAVVENTSNETRSYVVIVEVRKNDTTVHLAAESIQTPPSQSERLYIPWTPEEGGDYQVRAFLISSLESPQILSPVKTSEVTIIDNSFKGLVRMEKHACLGTCPVYNIDVYENRTAIFEGYVNVAKQGRHVFEISQEQLDELLQAFDKADFLSMKYTSPLAEDAPTVSIVFNMNGETNAILHQYGGPDDLLELEKQIDAILGTGRWVEGD